MMPEYIIDAIAVGVFVFVTIAVAGSRAIAALEKHRADSRREVTEYTGPLFSHRGRRLR